VRSQRARALSVLASQLLSPLVLLAQLGTEADQAGPVPWQRTELAHLHRGDPRLGQQIRAQQLRQDRLHTEPTEPTGLCKGL